MTEPLDDARGVYTDQPIFDAIAAATVIVRGGVEIHVTRFIETFNGHRDRALCISLDRPARATPPSRSDAESAQVLEYIDDLIWDVIYADRLTQAADRATYRDVNESRIETWQKLQDVIREKLVPSPSEAGRGQIKEATPAQHWNLPKGSPAKFVRNGILETCQCFDCRALSPDPGTVAK